jgi:VWFA-related protein
MGDPEMKVVVVFFLLLLSMFAQQNADQPVAGTPNAPASRSSDEDRRIALEVVVTDKSGNPVSGLQQQDFTVLDDKLQQKILFFKAVEPGAPDVPVKVILVVDAVNASFQVVASGLQEIRKFLGQNGGKLVLPVSMVLFSDSGTKQSESTRDGNALLAFLDKNESGLRSLTRSAGFNGAVERLQLSLQALGSLVDAEAQVLGRKMVIWIGPGWPVPSGPHVELNSQSQQVLFNSIVMLSTGLRQAHVTLYSVDPLGTADAGGFQTARYRDFIKGVTAANHTQAGNLALQVVAYQSGGRVLNSSNDIAGEIASCTTDANAFYVLSFDSAPPDGPIQYHGLEVKLDKPGLTARTRTGYYAQK